MFDIGFWELGLILLIGLIVLGPERLPRVARQLGLWVRRARATMQNFTSELEREMDVGEMREQFRQSGRYLHQARSDIESGVSDLGDSIQRDASGRRDHFRKARSAAPPTSSGAGGDDGPAETASDGDRRDRPET